MEITIIDDEEEDKETDDSTWVLWHAVGCMRVIANSID